MCVHSQSIKFMSVDTKYKNRKQILFLTDFASNNPICIYSGFFSKWIYFVFFVIMNN